MCLREMVGSFADALMSAEVDGNCRGDGSVMRSALPTSGPDDPVRNNTQVTARPHGEVIHRLRGVPATSLRTYQ